MEAVECIITTESVCICFWGFIPTCACFHSENFFVTCCFFRNGKKRGQVGGEVILVLAGLTSEKKMSEDKQFARFSELLVYYLSVAFQQS